MPTSHLTLICHALTEAQRQGRFARPDEDLVRPLPSPPPLQLRPGSRLLLAPEIRARLTAALWPVLSGLPTRVDPDLRDADAGCWQGRSLRDLEQSEPASLRQWLGDPDASPHGGESLTALRHRMAGWLSAQRDRGPTVVMTHPAVIRALAAHVLGLAPDHSDRLDIAPLACLQLSHYRHWRLCIG